MFLSKEEHKKCKTDEEAFNQLHNPSVIIVALIYSMFRFIAEKSRYYFFKCVLHVSSENSKHLKELTALGCLNKTKKANKHKLKSGFI